MKILLVSPLPPPEGGIASWTLKYLDFFKNREDSVSVVNTALIGGRSKRINRNRNMYDEIIRTFSICRKMKQELSKSCPNIVHINTSCSRFGVMRDACCVFMAKKSKASIVLHCHCNIEDQLRGEFQRKIFRWMTSQSKIVFVLNKFSEEFLKTHDCRTEVLPNFIDCELLVENHFINESLSEIGYVGHVQQTKGVNEILEVAKLFPNIHFSLLGPIHDAIKKEKIPENVSLLGSKSFEEVKEYYATADVFLFPSYTEGFSLSLTEAMASGLPCIVTSVGANEDMVENKGGVVIRPRNVEDICEAIKKISDKKIRNDMSLWNINKVKNNYLANDVLNKIVAFYKEIINEGISVDL